MDTLSAFARGQATRERPLSVVTVTFVKDWYDPRMVFDWELAARLIKEQKPMVARAGLRGDWGWTGGNIWENGAPVPKDQTYTYLASTWAVPELDLDGEIIQCYRMMSEVPSWDSGTYWPEEALEIVSRGD